MNTHYATMNSHPTAMKALTLFAASLALVFGSFQARAEVFTEMFSGGSLTIADGNPNPAQSSVSVSTVTPILSISSITVKLNGLLDADGVGDLKGYIQHNNSSIAVLFTPSNTPGSTSSQNYTFTDGNLLSSFGGQNPDGNWTLFFADTMPSESGTGGSLGSWELDITGVPEPTNIALAVFGLIVGGVGASKMLLRKSAKLGKAC